MTRLVLHHGDCLEVLRTMADNSVDSVVTDPPYGLSFMGKKWDYDVPSTEIWAECLRVLKPGGHLLAFAGTRTQHRMAVRIEDAGFEIRDMIAWVYGCLDEATEVATERGVMPYHKTKIGDRVLCYDAEHGEYTYQPILEIVEYEYSDTAYRLVGDFGEQVVSRNHRVLVERGGKEAFQLAETLGAEACVPVLESLPALQQAVRRTESKSGFAQQDMQQGVCQCADWERKHGFDASGSAQGRDDQMCGLRNGSLEAKRLAQEDFDACLQSRVQRRSSRGRVGEPCLQGAGELEAGIGSRAEGSHDRSVEPGLEGGIDVPQSQRCVCLPADKVRSLPGVDAADGAVGWLCDGAPIIGGACDWANLDAGGVRTPHQPQRDGQQPNEPHAVRDEWIAQGVRAWGGHNTSLVRVVPFHYTGKVWCLRVPTGAFVAVRNGVAFPTGNSGFPKSMDVSKQIDKHGGQSVAWFGPWFRTWREENGITQKQVAALFPSKSGGLTGCVANWELGLNMPTPEQFNLIRDTFGLPFDSVEAAEREIIGRSDATAATGGVYGEYGKGFDITAPATEAARQWKGWGTALKPALEPITVARKPLIGTVAANVLEHGTGALNIDGCRIPSGGEHKVAGVVTKKTTVSGDERKGAASGMYGAGAAFIPTNHEGGRWPANTIHDGSDEVLAGFPGTGAAARFFYCAKTSRKERNVGLADPGPQFKHGATLRKVENTATTGNNHPTVKPIDLMAYLCRLVTPPGGAVLDPFMGSGSTGLAALREGFRFVGIEREATYMDIAQARLRSVLSDELAAEFV